MIHISEVIQWFTYQRWYNDSYIRGNTKIHDCNMSITDIFNRLLFKGSNSHTVHWWLYCHMLQSLDTYMCIVRYSVWYLVTTVELYINITLIFDNVFCITVYVWCLIETMLQYIWREIDDCIGVHQLLLHSMCAYSCTSHVYRVLLTNTYVLYKYYYVNSVFQLLLWYCWCKWHFLLLYFHVCFVLEVFHYSDKE